MMLVRRFPMLRPCAPLWCLALGTLGLAGCGPGTAAPDSPAAAAATARAMVRPLLARSAALTTSTAATGSPTGTDTTSETTSGSTSVILVHRAEDGTLTVGCVGTEDGAEALVRDSEEAR